MAFHWWDFLEVAEELNRNVVGKAASKVPVRDAKLRTVVSRAYYAVLMSTSELLTVRHRFNRPKNSSHQAIKLELERHCKDVPEYKSLLAKLSNLQSARTNADYEGELPPDYALQSAAEEALHDAIDSRKEMRKLLPKKR